LHAGGQKGKRSKTKRETFIISLYTMSYQASPNVISTLLEIRQDPASRVDLHRASCRRRRTTEERASPVTRCSISPVGGKEATLIRARSATIGASRHTSRGSEVLTSWVGSLDVPVDVIVALSDRNISPIVPPIRTLDIHCIPNGIKDCFLYHTMRNKMEHVTKLYLKRIYHLNLDLNVCMYGDPSGTIDKTCATR
jgi:hypothetical protein